MILAVVSKKGGVGKTTTAIHLAAYLARKGRTLLIDSDDTRSATLWASQEKLPFTVTSETQAQTVSGDHQHVVIDTEGGLSDDDITALSGQVDLVVLPSPPATLGLSAVLETADVLKRGGQGERFRVLLTLVPPKPSTKGEAAREYLEGLHVPLLETQIRRSEAFEDASAQGVTAERLPTTRQRIPGMDYESAAREIMAIVGSRR